MVCSDFCIGMSTEGAGSGGPEFLIQATVALQPKYRVTAPPSEKRAYYEGTYTAQPICMKMMSKVNKLPQVCSAGNRTQSHSSKESGLVTSETMRRYFGESIGMYFSFRKHVNPIVL